MEGLTRLTLFVSGTSDADAEKSALVAAVSNLSEILEKTHSVTLRVLSFPSSLRPGVSVDPQAEINRQLQHADYDIYVGILGPRFGTPTPRAGSGTEEEFDVALSRFKADTRKLRILVYFNRSGADPFALEPEQLKKVQDFRQSLSSYGVLYRDFRNTAEFSDTIRNDLHNLIIDEWQQKSWRLISVADTHVTVESQASTSNVSDASLNVIREDQGPLDELGLFDLAIEYQSGVEAMNAALHRITQHTVSVGRSFELLTKEWAHIEEERQKKSNVGGSRGVQDYVAKARTLVERAAVDLEGYADSMAAEMSRFSSGSRALFASLRGMVDLQRQEGNWEGASGPPYSDLAQLRTILPRNIEQVTTFQALVARMPALTGRFRRARRRASSILGEFIVEIQYLIEESTKLLEETEYTEEAGPGSESKPT